VESMPRGGDAETLGARLADRRRALGMSQADLQRLTGVPKARISRYEHGHVVPSLRVLVRLVDHLDTSVDALTKGIFRETRR
jgi:transcriptional regulator with XRE-family HTH domain